MVNIARKRFGRQLVAAAAAASAVLTLSLVAGCSDDSDNSGKSGNDKITLNLGLFGTMGFKEAGLFDEYQKLHPNITIKSTSPADEQQYYRTLQTHLAANSGLSDIQGIEVGRIKEIVDTQAAKFIDVAKEAGASTADYLPWKAQQATTPDGKVLGLGTDVGPMAICYRTDLFKDAGLPTDREEVGKLWTGDWSKYIAAGEDFKKGNKNSKVAFMDTASGMYNAEVSSSATQYYDKDGKLIYQDNPKVKQAWDRATQAAQEGLTAKLRQFDTTWDSAFANSSFASLVCPSWMLAKIQSDSGPKNSGKWDVAQAPTAANWGGSFLAVPTASKHQKEAAELAAWLTAPEQQAKLFTKQAIFPSNTKAIDLPDVNNAKSVYFNNAPIGQIFGTAAKQIPVTTLGRKDGAVKDAISNGIQLVEQQGKSPDGAWNETVKNIEDAVG